ncbi:MAG: hypothetical protein JWR36_1692 [Glaciihabitans sp.]|jgi:uncharacterized membrane protein|nr:hypothetical protein [Glaciihabitans sp.]MDQ1571092.1 hypothetical protein [Actinomycetota bacterium]
MVTKAWSGFVVWSRRRPFVGGALTMVAGIEMFFSGQLDLGNIHVQLGIEGAQSTILPIMMLLLGLLAMLMPVHRIFYGVISLVVSVYSLIGLNLGGFFIGMLLGAVGGILVVSWMPKTDERAADDQSREASSLPGVSAELPPLAQRRL